MLINNKYLIESELGEGAFGKLYRGRHIYKNNLVAVKLHKIEHDVMIRNEAKILKLLINTRGVPAIRTFGKQDGILYMVIDLLGDSIERLNMNADINVILRTMRNLVSILHSIHDKGVIHRDLKPDNILFSSRNEICLIDFGLSAMFIDNNRNHIEELTNRNVVGNIVYVSNNIHAGCNPSRRDDIISVLYIAIKLITGELPWTSYDKDVVGLVKREINLRDYFNERIPQCIYDIYAYCNTLAFKERPNYDYICKGLIV